MVVLHKQRLGTIVLYSATLAVSAGLLLGAGLLSGCGKIEASARSAPPPAMPVTVVKADQRDVPVTGEWVGTLDGTSTRKSNRKQAVTWFARIIVKDLWFRRTRCFSKSTRAH